MTTIPQSDFATMLANIEHLTPDQHSQMLVKLHSVINRQFNQGSRISKENENPATVHNRV